MDYSKLFYWLTVADNAKSFFKTFAILFTATFIIVTIVRIVQFEHWYEEDKFNKVNKWTWYTTPFMLLFISLSIFTPNKKDALLIVAGGQTMNFLTTNEKSKELPNELVNYLLVELRTMAKETEIDLDIINNKQKIIDRAKTMTSEQLIKEMKVDSTFAKVLLGNK